MSGYVRESEVSFVFDGQTLKVKIRPIEYKDILKFEKIDAKLDIADAILFMTDIVRNYAVISQAINANDGTPITLDEICSKAYFTELLSDIGKAVIETGSIPRPLT